MSSSGAVSAVKKQHQIDGTQLAKTRLCLFYQESRCKYGFECTYAHNVEEVRKAPEELRKTKFCELFMDPLRGCTDVDCNFAHDSVELRSKKDARRASKARNSLRLTPSSSLPHQSSSHRMSQVSTNALELMQQLAALLAAVSPPPSPSTLASLSPIVDHSQSAVETPSSGQASSLLNLLGEALEAEQLTGLSEILGPRESCSANSSSPSSEGQAKRLSLATTATSPLSTGASTSAFSLF
jgi:hypothetical protein